MKMATLASIILPTICIKQDDALSKICDLSIDPITVMMSSGQVVNIIQWFHIKVLFSFKS